MAGLAGSAAGGAADAAVPPVDTEAATKALAEISQGLAAPAVDCRESKPFSIGCVSVSGTYGGTAFDFSCVDKGGLVYAVNQGGGVQCEGDVSGHPLNIDLHLGPLQPRSMGEFAAASASKDTHVAYLDIDRSVGSHRNGIYQLEASYERRFAVVGSAEIAAMVNKLRMDGEFAASYTPGNCAPNADGFGCETVLVRGNFAAFPIVR
ncbi:MAG TPA: hypothetical protein VK509_23180 [Polyangiales bacterium]|nr:hypothetical protein [Polyangiales bacterium]